MRKPAHPSSPLSGSGEVSRRVFPPSWGTRGAATPAGAQCQCVSLCVSPPVPPCARLHAACQQRAVGQQWLRGGAGAGPAARCLAPRHRPDGLRPPQRDLGLPPAPAGATAGCQMEQTVAPHFGHGDHPQPGAEPRMDVRVCAHLGVGAPVGVWHRKPSHSGLLPPGACVSLSLPVPPPRACQLWGCGCTGAALGMSPPPSPCLAFGDITRTLAAVGHPCCSTCNTRTGVCWAEPAARWK